MYEYYEVTGKFCRFHKYWLIANNTILDLLLGEKLIMDRLNDDQNFESTDTDLDLLELAENFEKLDDETKSDLALAAFRAIQTESGRNHFANLLNPNGDSDSLQTNEGSWAHELEQALDQLAEVKETLELMKKTTKTSVWRWDADTDKKTFEENYYAMIGYSQQKIEKFNKDNIEVFLTHPDDLKESDELLSACKNGDINGYEFESRIKRSDGIWTRFKDTVQIARRDENDYVTQIIGIRTDVDALYKAENRNKRWIKSFANSELGIAIGQNSGIQIGMNNYAFQKMYGYSVGELYKLSFMDLFAPEKRSEIENKINEKYKSFHINTESVHTRKDGSEFTALADIHVEKDKHNKIIYSSITVIDITHIKELEKKLLEMALTDKLTGLYSRHHLDEQSEILQKSNRQYPISIINIDIDGLKIINDTYGHTAGDKLLKKMGAVIKNVFRQEDCVCRAGGDEFVILLPGIDEASALEKIDLIMASLAHFNQIDSDHILSLSIGTATVNNYTKDYEKNWDTAYQAADQRMRDNKKAKKNGVITP